MPGIQGRLGRWPNAVTAAIVTAGRIKNLALSVHPGDLVTRSGLFQLAETADMYLGLEAPAPARLQQRASPSQERGERRRGAAFCKPGQPTTDPLLLRENGGQAR